MKLQLYTLSLGDKEEFRGTIFQCAGYILRITEVNKKNLLQRIRNCADKEYNFQGFTVKKAGLSKDIYRKFRVNKRKIKVHL